MAFETPLPPAVLNGTLTTELRDPLGINPPSTIIQATDAFQVYSRLDLTGLAVPMLGGSFQVSVYAESIGPGFEGQLGATVNVPCTGTTPLEATVNVPAMGAPRVGAYKLTTIWLYSDVAGNPWEIAGFAEGPVFQIRP